MAAVGLAVPAVGGVSPDLEIGRISVSGPGQVDAPALLELLGLRVGESLDRRQLRQSIHAIYARAEVEWIQIEGTEIDGTLHVVVRVNLRTTISEIEVRAKNPVFRTRIRNWLELAPGARVSAGLLETARRRVLRRLRDRGYAEATVDLFADFDRPTNTAKLTVQVDTGDPQVIESVVLVGQLDGETASEAMPDYEPGSHLTSRIVERIRRDAESNLRRLGYWDAEVPAVERRADGSRVTLQLLIEPGPGYRLELSTRVEQEELVRDAIPDPAEEDLHPAQTVALAERIRERLQEEGHLLADVAVELVRDDEEQTLRVTADSGGSRRISAVEFPGAASVDEGRLREVVRVRPGPVRGLTGRKVSSATLENDRLALIETYRSYGFVGVVVSPPVLEPDGPDAVRVLFPVDEGQRWLLTDVRIQGLPVEAAARLEQVGLGIIEASPWYPGQVDTARRQLELALADTGYPHSRVEAEIDTSVPGEAKVTLRTETGPYVEISNVVIAGLTTTRESVVQRILRRSGVVVGAPFARDRILQAQRELYQLGLFRRVELFPIPGQERRTKRGLVVQCEEGRQRSYLVGVGWNETDRFRITLGWSHLNLFGGAHAFTAETRLSPREQRFQLGLREPRVPKLGVPGYLVVYRTFEEFARFSQLRRGLWFEIGDRLKKPLRPWIRYEYQIVEPDAPDDVLSDLEREDQEARIASITPTLELDFRNDPLIPTQGTFTSLSVEYAFPAFATNAEFLKVQTQFSMYGEVLDGVGAIGIRLGAIEPLASDTGEPKNLQVPLNTRFFAGGSSSHRGFATDFLGIPGETVDDAGEPIGGNALVLLNLEYQQPISGLFSAVVFVDAGNVWAEPSRVRLEDVRVAAGLGLRVDTPAGPLRAEYGFKLDREPDESSGEFFLSFGIPF